MSIENDVAEKRTSDWLSSSVSTKGDTCPVCPEQGFVIVTHTRFNCHTISDLYFRLRFSHKNLTAKTQTLLSFHKYVMDDKNYSLYGLPVAIVLAYVPHVVKGAIITKSLGKYNNVNPRSQLEKVQSRMTKASYEMAKRADAAHHNGLEIFPIFAGAVLAGNFAGLPNSTLNKYSAVFLTARFFYNFVYIKNSNSIVAGLRSLIWMVSIVSCFGLYLEAAKGKL